MNGHEQPGYGGAPPPYGAPPAGYGPPPGGGYGGPPLGPRTDALAIVALIAGLLAIVGAIANLASGVIGFCCPVCGSIAGAAIGAIVAIPSLTGLVTGILGYKRTSEQPDVYTGKGLALTGIITSSVALLMTVLVIVGPWLGWGLLGATAPNPPPSTTQPWMPFGVDASLPDAGAAAIAPSLPADPNAVDPNVVDPSAAGSACARVAPCCRAYVAAMGTIPASTCDAYHDVSAMPESMCQSAIDGWRGGLSATNRAVPPECQ
jgi:hypothetical protein